MVCLPSRSYGFESHCSQRSVYVFVTSASGVFFFIELSMPQMDKVAFFSQLFWLMVTFYGFYMITVKTHLPNLARILKVRKKKVEFALKQGSSFQEERASTVASYENVFVNSATDSRTLLTQLSQSGSTWLESSAKDINNNTLTQLNQDYVLLNGELRGKRFVVHQLAKAGK